MLHVFLAALPFLNPVDAIVTDIEGTTTSISFVKETLFPYAREQLEPFVEEHAGDPRVRAIADEVCLLAGVNREEVASTLLSWMDEDKKITPLKELQGMIWKEGYEGGALQGHFYDDVPVCLTKWKERGIALYIYSSGSIEAQRLLAAYSDHGDLTPLFDGYFDTKIGGKKESGSYSAIAEQIGIPPENILFLSDTVAELHAADAAGFQTLQICRDDSPALMLHRHATTFYEIEVP